MNKMNAYKKLHVYPLYACQASSCLTNQDLILAGVDIISLSLRNLLIRPGLDFLRANNLRKYIAWDKKIILNCASLHIDSKKQFNINSETDGNKYVFDVDDIQNVINTIEADIVIYPKDIDKKKCAHQEYFETEIGVNNHSDRFYSGNFTLENLLNFKTDTDLYIENQRPSLDGYVGIFYRDMHEESILDDSWELSYTKLDKHCQCYTCFSEYTCAHLHHLFKNTPLLAQRLLILHNVFYINHLP